MPAGDATFPLIPRFRLIGVPFGSIHSARRGIGADVAGTRTYVPGDPLSAIDWRASARLSTARNADEFIVRDRFADESPRVLVLADRRPAMTLYPPDWPWLSKPAAMAGVIDAIAASAFRARGLFGYLDLADEDEPFWSPPRTEPQWRGLEDDYRRRPFTAADDTVERGLQFLRFARLALPPGTFLFVVSDFLVTPPSESWLAPLEQRWDVVPVVVQDPTWERSFPEAASVALPIVDAATGRADLVRLTAKQARAVRESHERRHERLLDDFIALGLDPVVVESEDPEDILRTFLAWADRRRLIGQQWRLGA